MSQSGILADLTSSAANIETLTGDSGGAVGPNGAFNVDILGSDSSVNNDNGITVVGDPANNKQTVTLTNRVTGQITTTDAVVTAILTLAAGVTPAAFIIDNGNICGFNSTDGGGGAYFFTAGVTTDGTTATELGSEFPTEFEDAAMAASDISFTVSGNNIIIQVQGIAGKTINWNASFTYRKVS